MIRSARDLGRHLLLGLLTGLLAWEKERQHRAWSASLDDVCECGHSRFQHDGPGGPDDHCEACKACKGFRKAP